VKINIKIVFTVLLLISITAMFLPIAHFNDNSAASMQADIDKQADKVTSAQTQLDRWIEGGKKSEADINKQRDKVAKEQGKLDELLAKQAAMSESNASGIAYAFLPNALPLTDLQLQVTAQYAVNAAAQSKLSNATSAYNVASEAVTSQQTKLDAENAKLGAAIVASTGISVADLPSEVAAQYTVCKEAQATMTQLQADVNAAQAAVTAASAMTSEAMPGVEIDAEALKQIQDEAKAAAETQLTAAQEAVTGYQKTLDEENAKLGNLYLTQVTTPHSDVASQYAASSSALTVLDQKKQEQATASDALAAQTAVATEEESKLSALIR